MSKYLLARLSAMGDVAMLLPVVYAVARANPQHEFTLLTQPLFTTLMVNPPDNLEAMAIDIRREERGFVGLMRYADRIKRERFDAFIDLHDVLRTKALRWRELLSGGRVYHLRKPRRERSSLLRPPGHKVLRPLPGMISIYSDTLRRAGLDVPSAILPIEPSPADPLVTALLEKAKGKALVGIAPFASTESKTYALELMEQVVHRLAREGGCHVFLFGGRGEEARILEDWSMQQQGITSVAGTLDLSDELTLISRLACMVSMDSANMHLASAVGTPVVSLWCATHPYAGFLGLGQSLDDCLQDEELDCRPCTIFGKMRSCVHGSMPCRSSVPPERIVERVMYHVSPRRLPQLFGQS